MWGRLAAWMRFDGVGPGKKPSPLKRRLAPVQTILVETAFSPNPGNLRMFSYVPPGLKKGAPLVVVLHGCGQSAGGYDFGAGWSQLAARSGFAVLAVEQKALNNPNTCFNWFNPDDTRRGEGEAASIASMIATMIANHALDASRVFITGLSAGGAMTAVMLATYPELFAGGAIIAGLPFGAAGNVRDALDAMRSAPVKSPREWGDLVRAASPHTGPWPKVSIWHGDRDTTVNSNNAQASAAQWADLQGLKLADAAEEKAGGVTRLRWGDRLEVHTISGLAHGTPIDSRDLGVPAPFLLEAGLSSTRRIAQFWGLIAAAPAKPGPNAEIHGAPPQPVLPKIEALLAPQRRANTRMAGVIRRTLKALLPKR
jgi:poly(hydroxyalkanoate) depolymerase family esterase